MIAGFVRMKGVTTEKRKKAWIKNLGSGTTGKSFTKIPGSANGKKNSQYGTKWMMKDGYSKKVRSDEVQMMTQSGWIFGRCP
jgi:hypothetical protein